MNILYLHGFASSPNSSKARFFADRLTRCGAQVHIPDLAANDFEHLTITGQLAVIEHAADGRPVTLFGSSMGGYLAALYAARHPEVERAVLLAPAFGMTRRWHETLGVAALQQWRETGWRNVYHYGDERERRLSYGLIADGLSFEDFPDVRQPTLIFHGTRDNVVPAGLSEDFARRSPESRKLVRLDSGHELTEVLERMWAETAVFLNLPALQEP